MWVWPSWPFIPPFMPPVDPEPFIPPFPVPDCIPAPDVVLPACWVPAPPPVCCAITMTPGIARTAATVSISLCLVKFVSSLQQFRNCHKRWDAIGCQRAPLPFWSDGRIFVRRITLPRTAKIATRKLHRFCTPGACRIGYKGAGLRVARARFGAPAKQIARLLIF